MKPDPVKFAVALSGGGHRASLFALGALMASVDRRLNLGVAQISSVSGGSITNAFVAERCHFEQLEPDEFDPIAAELIDLIVRRGILTRPKIAVMVGACVSVGAGVGFLTSGTEELLIG